MTQRILLALATFGLAAPSSNAQPFVKNEQDRARIEAALPARAPAKTSKPRRLLIFTLNVNYGGHPSIAYANEAFTLMGRKTGAFETVVSNDPKVFERESLKSFDAVFFNNTVGNCFTNADLRRNLLEFVIGGGGLMGVHGTSVAFTRWPGAVEDWPEFGYLIGARGANHKDSDEHLWMKLDDPENPILGVFQGKPFDFRDEFFRPQGTYSRERVRVLLSIDTGRSDPNKGQARGDCYRADNDYAVAWIRSYGKGRVFYCTIAHNPYVFWDAKMLSFYLAAAQFALGDLPCPTTPSAKLNPAVRVQEKLGWRLALDASELGPSTLYETSKGACRLRLAYLIGSDNQSTGAHVLKSLGPQLTDAELEEVRLTLEAATVRLLAYRVTGSLQDDAAARTLFEFGRKMGVEMFVMEQSPNSFDRWGKLAEDYKIKLAFTARTRAAAGALAKAVGQRSAELGVALNLGDPDWTRSQLSDTLGEVRSRLFFVKLPENQTATGATERWLLEIRKAGAKPIFSIDPSSGRNAVDLIDTATLKLASQ